MITTIELVKKRYEEVGYNAGGVETYMMACKVINYSKIWTHLTKKQIVNALIQYDDYVVPSPS